MMRLSVGGVVFLALAACVAVFPAQAKPLNASPAKQHHASIEHSKAKKSVNSNRHTMHNKPGKHKAHAGKATKTAKVTRMKTAAPKNAALIVHANTGKVLYHYQADSKCHPASLTKMMTLYLAFEAVAEKKLGWEQPLKVSKKAASMPRSNLALRPGETVKVREAVLGLITRSANDAAVVLAEAISGSEAAFASKMTERARQLGMKDTIFQNASGWHNPKQVTTAYDMARLAIALRRDYPRDYKLFATASFVFRGQTIHTHNHLVTEYPGADGLKTGYVSASGFNVVTSAERNGQKLIAVYFGGTTARARDQKVAKLLDEHFSLVGKMTASNEQKQYSPASAQHAASHAVANPAVSNLPTSAKIAQYY
jgi:D-alanyl-D-alanine carboxypeptidase